MTATQHQNWTRITPACVLVPAHNRDEWLDLRQSGIGASEIAAVLGISPWQSPFSLYHHKRGLDTTSENTAMRWGTKLEALVADEFAEQNPKWRVDELPPGILRNNHRPWQVCTPDRLLCARGDIYPSGLLEVKTTGSWDEWGDEGTDQIPAHYRAQVQWQMDTTGLPFAHVAVLNSGCYFRTYRVEYDEDDAAVMRAAAEKFWAMVQQGEPPSVDGHGQTTATLKALHPDLDDTEVDVDPDLAAEYRIAVAEFDLAEARRDRASNRLLDAIGRGHYAYANGEKVATRSVYEQRGYVATYKPRTVVKLLPVKETRKP